MNACAARILIVDDEVKNRRLLEVLLKHEGYLTVSAASGDEALALIEEQAPDLILLDALMPTVDGYQVARILKAHPSNFNIPIIMVSAQDDRTARLAGLNAGAEEFLTKPIDRDELWLRVRNLLRLKSDGDLLRTNSLVLEERIQARTLDLQRFRTAMDATSDVLTLIDRGSMRYIEVNAAASSLLGYTREEFLSMGPAHLAVDGPEQLERIFDEIIAGDGAGRIREAILRRKDGSQVCVEVNLQALQTGEVWTIVSVARDITQRKQTESQLQQLAHYDPLTGLPNRRLFQDSLSKAIEQADALDLQAVLLYLDVDNFKDINDGLGHSLGDQLLRGLGDRLLGSLNVRDMVGRLGGDEFGIILLTPRDPEIGMIVANKIHEALRVPFELGGNSVKTSASIGIAVYPTDTDDAGLLARYADMAMYEAKRSGRNASRFYTAAMNQRVGEKVTLVAALREALVREEFVLHYQPKVSLRTGRWTGVEALLRWQRPGHGLVPPNLFIPALEESGLIVPVGAWVIATACRQLADWQRRGMDPLPIAVNVSPLQLVRKRATAVTEPGARPDTGLDDIELLSAVKACLEAHEFGAGQLEIEITESMLMDDAEYSIEVLQHLRALGIAISIDDFGTGYSSLSYLRRFPLEALKIDGSFVRDVTTSAEDASIAVAIIELAHRLKLQVIAECVETTEQMQFLQTHECDQAQGYHFARPMPLAELEAMWSNTSGQVPDVITNTLDVRETEVLASAWPECAALGDALLAGSGVASMAIVERKLEDGHGMVDIDRHLIQPALYSIGRKWRSREIGVAQEHLATALALSIMSQGLSRSHVARPTGKKVLLACAEGNHHAVGLQMVANAFTLAGWEVNFLGANVPIDALILHVRQWSPDLVGLSASLPQHVREVRTVTRKLQQALGEQCPRVLIGGLGFNASNLAAEPLAGVDWCPGPAAAVVAGQRLCMPTLADAQPQAERNPGLRTSSRG